jgi:HEAT repeat protein
MPGGGRLADEVQTLRDAGRLADALRLLVREMGARSRFQRDDAWRRHLLGPHGLAWEYGRWHAADNDFLTTIALLEEPPVTACAERSGPFVVAMLRGQVFTLRAAAAERRGNTSEAARCRAEAARHYLQTVSAPDDGRLGGAIVDHALRYLQGEGEETDGEAWLLLAERQNAEGQKGLACRLAVRLVPGAGGIFPAPPLVGLAAFEPSFLGALRDAWRFAVGRWGGPGDVGACWWVGDLREMAPVEGGSVGAAAAVAFRAALTGTPLDPHVAVSAHLLADVEGALGDVEGARAKAEAAVQADCDRVVFAPETAKGLRAAWAGARGLVQEAATVDDAWEHLTGRRRVLQKFLAAEERHLLDQLQFRPAAVQDFLDTGKGSGREALERAHVPLLAATDAPETSPLPRAEPGTGPEAAPNPAGGIRGPAELGARVSVEVARQAVRRLDDLVATWLESPGAAAVLLAHPGAGKTQCLVRCGLRLLGAAGQALDAPGGRGPLPLLVMARELWQRLPHGESFPDVVAEVVVSRFHDAGAVPAEVQTLRDVLRGAFARPGGVVLLLDGWDERAAGGPPREGGAAECDALLKKLTRWCGRPEWNQWLLLTSRMVGFSQEVLAGSPRWSLLPLEGDEDLTRFIDGWLPATPARTLKGLLAEHGALARVLRTPLLAAVVCQSAAYDPELKWVRGATSRTEVLRGFLHLLLAATARGTSDPKVAAEGNYRLLEDVAYWAYTGSPWEPSEEEFHALLTPLCERQPWLGGPRSVIERLTGPVGLFTRSEGRLTPLHPSFGELLAAEAVRRRLNEEKGRDDPGARLEKWCGPRLLDPRWHEVWLRLAAPAAAGQGETTEPLLRALLRLHERWGARRGPRDDLFGSALALAGYCVAEARGWDLPAGQQIVRRIAGYWGGRHRPPTRPADDGDAFHDVIVALGRAGHRPPVDRALAARSLAVRVRAARALAEIDPGRAADEVRLVFARSRGAMAGLVRASATGGALLAALGAWVVLSSPWCREVLWGAVTYRFQSATSCWGWICALMAAAWTLGILARGVKASITASERATWFGLSSGWAILFRRADRGLWDTAVPAVAALGPASAARLAPDFEEYLCDPRGYVRLRAAECLAHLGRPGFAALVRALHLTSPDRVAARTFRGASDASLGRDVTPRHVQGAVVHGLCHYGRLLGTLSGGCDQTEALPRQGLVPPGEELSCPPDAVAVLRNILHAPLSNLVQEANSAPLLSLLDEGATPGWLVTLLVRWQAGRWRAAEALAALGRAGIGELLAAARHPRLVVAVAGQYGLSTLGPASAPLGGEVLGCLADPSPSLRSAAAKALAAIGKLPPPAAAPLVRLLRQDNSPWVRKYAAEALGHVEPGTDGVVPALVAAAREPREGVRAAAVHALGRLGPPREAIECLTGALHDRCAEVSLAAGAALARCIPPPDGLVAQLRQALATGTHRHTRRAAAVALARFGDQGAGVLSNLACGLRDRRSYGVTLAIEALAAVGAPAAPYLARSARRSPRAAAVLQALAGRAGLVVFARGGAALAATREPLAKLVPWP